MSSVELKVIHEDFGTAEDDHRKDVLRWGFKPVRSSDNANFLWVENGRLRANTPTVQAAQPPLPVMQSNSYPSLTPANTQIYVRASLPHQAVSYDNLPRNHVATVEVHDMATSSHYLAQVKFDDGRVFELHVDTGSTISWVCGFDREDYEEKFDLAGMPESQIPHSYFEAAYMDNTNVSGVVCKAKATFGDSAFRIRPWTFCVATSANDRMKTAPSNSGVLALSFRRPPGGSHSTQFHPGVEAVTFVESLYRARLIGSYKFCVKLRRRAEGFITFGKLPKMGSKYIWQDAIANRWALPSTRIGFIDGDGNEFEHIYDTQENKRNVALFDTGTDCIFIENKAVNVLYTKLCGINNFKMWKGTLYIRAGGIAKLKHSYIYFYFGNSRFALPAKLLQGKYSPDVEACISTIQGKSGGPIVDDNPWSFDVMRSAFFRHALVAFDTRRSRPRIAIHANSNEENHED